MAQRRMFSPIIVNSDAFLDMPLSTQLLYFHLGMAADDDGFVNPKKIMRMIGIQEDDLKILIAKRFVLSFKTGVIVIKHWKINNLVRKDWYRETIYLDEKQNLLIKDNGAYTENSLVNDSLTVRQHRLGKVSIGKDNILDASRHISPNGIKKEPSEQQQLYRRIIGYLQETLNMTITMWGKQCSAIKSMLDAGYTELQITKTIDYMAHKDEFYADKGFDMTTVAKQIPIYKARMRKPTTI